MTTSSRADTRRPRHSTLSWRLAALAAVASLALTACSGPASDTTELVVYVVSEEPVFIEDATEGTTIGDIRSRSYESYATLTI
jgi:anti-sigma-K factor RskA